jgi:hypothetical protein
MEKKDEMEGGTKVELIETGTENAMEMEKV